VDAAIERHRLYGTKDRELADKESWNDRVYETIQGYGQFCVRFVGPRLPCLANIVDPVATPPYDITTSTVVDQRPSGDSNVPHCGALAQETMGEGTQQVPSVQQSLECAPASSVVGTKTDKNKTLQALIQEKIAKEKLAGKKTSADTTLPKSDLPITSDITPIKTLDLTESLAGVTGMQQGSYPKQDIFTSVDFLRRYGHGRGYYNKCKELPETLPIFYADPTKHNDNLPAFSGGTPYCRWDEGRVMCLLLPKPEDTAEKPRVVNVYGVVVGSVSWNCTYGTCLMQSGRLQSFGCSVMSIADTRVLDQKYSQRCPHDRLNKWFAAKIVDHAALTAEVNEAV
jgi:hypothetical protein